MSYLSRRGFLKGTALASLVPVVGKLHSADIADVYRAAPVIDALTIDSPDFDVEEALDAGLKAAVVDLAIYPRSQAAARDALKGWEKAFQDSNRLHLVLDGQGLREAFDGGRFGIILACQDASILGPSSASVNDANLDALEGFFKQGLRVLQLTHNERNAVGDAYREKSDAGLSRLGEKVVAEMNRLGMLIDLSHCGDRTTEQAIELSDRPCAITHAGCRALYKTKRNKPDNLIRKVAEKGGFFGVFNMSVWLTNKPTADVNTVVDHIDHAVKLAGVEHVGFGSDGPVGSSSIDPRQRVEGFRSYVKRNFGLPGAERYPDHVIVEELNSPERLLVLARALERRGYRSGEIEKIIGGNFQRVFAEAT